MTIRDKLRRWLGVPDVNELNAARAMVSQASDALAASAKALAAKSAQLAYVQRNSEYVAIVEARLDALCEALGIMLVVNPPGTGKEFTMHRLEGSQADEAAKILEANRIARQMRKLLSKAESDYRGIRELRTLAQAEPRPPSGELIPTGDLRLQPYEGTP